MQVLLRRAEPRDADAIIKLVKGEAAGKDDMEKTLKKRFGDRIDIPDLIDTAPFSLVGTDADDHLVLGFMAFSNGPPPVVDDNNLVQTDDYVADPRVAGVIARQEWDKWVRKWWDFKDVQVTNTKFLSFFVADPDHSLAFLDLALTTTFTLLPNLKYIGYLLPESVILFPPLSSAKYVPPATPTDDTAATSPMAPGGKKTKPPAAARRAGGRGGRKRNTKYFAEVGVRNSNATFVLHVCSRKDVVPTVKVRRARVEDCDDLVPMFRKQNLLKGKHADFYVAELLESKSESSKTLVAEADGEVVGFMSLNRDVDQEMLAETFHLEPFDFLMK
ncbi:hypothetical protein HK104_008407, partial [Borealophlyctis nickersoniae]